MKIQFDPVFIHKLKKSNVRVRKSFKEKIIKFSKNPHDPKLNNHPLKGEWQGHRSIDIASDWRAIYEEVQEGEEIIAYFVTLGTHKELYTSLR